MRLRYRHRVADQIKAAWWLWWRTFWLTFWYSPADRWVMATCFHHDRKTGESYITDTLIDLGRDKVFKCRECSESWTLGDFER